MRPTIKDVGRLAGVSVGTVSKALNSPDMVSEATRMSVLEAVRELDYRPNRAAQGLVGRRSFQVGYGLPHPGAWGNPSLDTFLHAIVDAAAGRGLDIVLFALPYGTTDRVGPYVDMVRRGAVDGFVLTDTDYHDDRIPYLVEQGIPFVSFGQSDDPVEFSWIDVDGAAGTRSATEHLVELGHTKVGLIAWPEGSRSGDARVHGVFETLTRHGLPEPAVVRSENGIDQGRAAYQQLIASAPDVTAVVCVQDELALGAMAAARAEGTAIGIDRAFVGFDDTPTASIIHPQLTSVRQPFERIGDELVSMLDRALGGDRTPRQVLLEPDLIIRESSTGGGA